ncbi:MAG TPA: hybrid sensor histidine kinase/response regulator [Polyangiales bacterium]|nr:hybrid sensor histidine kinase/response regulator [Polyangiales bacterium]
MHSASQPVRTSVLIVDDTVENLQLLARMLEAHGYEVRPVTSGRQALQAAKSYPPELVLLDVNMPEMDGYEVCRQFKAIPELREVPVIFLTALSDTQDKIKAFESGGSDYITKPFQVDEVLARVRVHVGLRQSRAELMQSYQRLQALERLREDLVRMVVHDMRSPLMALMGLLHIVQQELAGSLSAEISDDLASAVHAAARINRMANEVLDVSRLEEGKLPLDLQKHDLVAMCRETVHQLMGLDPERRIQITGADALEVQCDRDVIGRVLENLVSNAIKHSPERGSIRISVQADAARARVAVRDEGPGVPPERRAKIFEKFGAVQARHDRSFHSSGLGLAFCKLAVEAHGGTLGVEPVQPSGSEFWFALPS